MEIKRIDDFVKFCQENSQDAELPQAASFAFQLADESTKYLTGGLDSIVPKPQDIDGAYKQVNPSIRPEIGGLTFMKGAEILDRFWEHKNVFRQWLSTKVDVVDLLNHRNKTI